MKKKNLGFTLIELVLVMAIASSLLGFVIFNLVGTQKTSEISVTADKLVSDLASQQTKAMLGSGPSSGTDYGVYFQPDRYILFKGSFYSPADSNNFTVMLDEGQDFSNITFPGQSIVFVSATGTVSGFLNGNSSITIGEANGSKQKTVTVNRYGVVTGEN
jgi:prepilin-type N-terminal cleavage/methylation domain-containing protein